MCCRNALRKEYRNHYRHRKQQCRTSSADSLRHWKRRVLCRGIVSGFQSSPHLARYPIRKAALCLSIKSPEKTILLQMSPKFRSKLGRKLRPTNKKSPNLATQTFRARNRTRTCTALRPLVPETSVSTNFTIRAVRHVSPNGSAKIILFSEVVSPYVQFSISLLSE